MTKKIKRNFPFHFDQKLLSLEPKMWKEVDQLTQQEITNYLQDVLRGQVKLTLATNPDYRHTFQEIKVDEQADDGYYIHLEKYSLASSSKKTVNYFAQRIIYDYLLAVAVKGMLWKLRLNHFHQDQHFQQIFKEILTE